MSQKIKEKKKSGFMEDTAYQYGFSDPEDYVIKFKKGLSKKVVEKISKLKNEPTWMLQNRLRAYDIFLSKSMPKWGGNLDDIDFNNIYYYLKPTPKESKTWEEVPKNIKKTFDRLGIPKAEQDYLAGVKTQYDSELVYGSVKKELEDKGVIFMGTDEGLLKYPEIFKQYFGTVIPSADNKFAALNTAVWSGGSFVYVPKGVKVDLPLQAYFRINAKNIGQFERTLIIAEENSFVNYVEGCTAPVYTSDSLHSAVVEIIVKKNARVRYTTIQNWSSNVYNLVTKRAFAYENSVMEWVDGNIGSKVTMKYPSVYLMGKGAKGEVLSLAYAGDGQHQDTGGKFMHLAPNTSSKMISKSISKGSGRASYRGMVKIAKNARNSKSNVECDALLINKNSRTDTYPFIKNDNNSSKVGHEASVSKVDDEQLFYLMSRGLTKEQASALIISGFIEPIVKLLPMEYAAELNKLIELEMEGSVG
ncbi:Fe-S cluster assembly protein SufB [candidate division WWE3 bacterium CG10_big_fil_rev_8_21_14_0_10_32_10]|uniref:Fe-S cluster assembly protein SufB n=1 Tax=candidate division WWE3 bacterium CG10_big_fil_rev_8_21_14_0_10_32_10 TaxID=1975090 RepID=A0A2H0R9E7_UNCKA|nr:MAG: Fe-S cluster assembly protein SufB [candidate division WWE3 bacterium CG10_big_fil_rev_8_21_14_0_10_32_10]